MLVAEQFSKYFGSVCALKDVGFCVRDGEILGIIGPNGAGKTTLLQGLAGLLPMNSGRLSWNGSHLLPRRRSKLLFYLEDGTAPHADLCVGVVVDFYAKIFGRKPDERDEALERFDISRYCSIRIKGLSKGTMKRLLLSLAWLAQQKVMLLDEPFEGLDLRQVREVTLSLRDLTKRGKSLLLSIHQLRDAERSCDQFLLLNSGAVVAAGTLCELQAKIAKPNANLEDVFYALV